MFESRTSGQRRADSARDQREQHHDEPRRRTTSPPAPGPRCTRWRRRPARPTSEQLFQLTFAGNTNALSSPYFDYDSNRLYFGDGNGRLHRINNAHPTRRPRSSGWPITCTTTAFQSPMHYANQLVAGNTNGYLYRIDTSAGSPTCIQAQRLGGGTAAEGNPGGLTSPTIDVTNSKILVTDRRHLGRREQGAGGLQPDVRRRRGAGRRRLARSRRQPFRRSSRRSTTTSGRTTTATSMRSGPPAPTTRC